MTMVWREMGTWVDRTMSHQHQIKHHQKKQKSPMKSKRATFIKWFRWLISLKTAPKIVTEHTTEVSIFRKFVPIIFVNNSTQYVLILACV